MIPTSTIQAVKPYPKIPKAEDLWPQAKMILTIAFICQQIETKYELVFCCILSKVILRRKTCLENICILSKKEREKTLRYFIQ